MKRLGRPAILLACTMLALSGCDGGPVLMVHGDSTAVGAGQGLAKIMNLAPGLDGARWSNQVANAQSPRRHVYNTGKSGSTIQAAVDRMRASPRRRAPTIIYDRINLDETLPGYLAGLETVVTLIEGDQWLILPQVPRAAGQENPEILDRMARVDAYVRGRWPDHTFTENETRVFLGELASAHTRLDGLHRNAAGQAIEARHVTAWTRRAGW